MSKYTAEFKEEVVRYYLDGKGGYAATGKHFVVGFGTVRKWIKAYQYHGEASTKAKYTHYTAEFKATVLKHMKLHDLSYTETAARFDIRNPNAIGSWEHAYNLGGLAGLTSKKRGRSPIMPKQETPPESKEKPTYEELEKKLAWLEMENAYLKKLDALIRQKQQEAQRTKRKR